MAHQIHFSLASYSEPVFISLQYRFPRIPIQSYQYPITLHPVFHRIVLLSVSSEIEDGHEQTCHYRFLFLGGPAEDQVTALNESTGLQGCLIGSAS